MNDKTEDKIRKKAFELYLQRNGRSGSGEEDWLSAEKKVKMTEESGVKIGESPKKRPAEKRAKVHL